MSGVSHEVHHRNLRPAVISLACENMLGRPVEEEEFYLVYFYVLMSWGPPGGQQTEYNT